MEKLIEFLEDEKYSFEWIDDCKAIQIEGFTKVIIIEAVGTHFEAHTEKYNDDEFTTYNDQELKTLKGVEGYIKRHAL